jgi:trigger factor
MVEREIDYMLKDLDFRLRYQGIGIEKYAELMGITLDTLREDFRESAANRVKTNLVLEAIGKAEGIDATEEEIAKRAEEIALSYGTKDIEKMKNAILATEKAIIKEELVNNKVIEFLVNNSKEV